MWEFGVVPDTHTQSLDDDLAKSAVLLDESGGRNAAKPLPAGTRAFAFE